MNNNDLLINKIIDKLIKDSDNNSDLGVSVEEVHELRRELGDSVFIPVLTMEEIAKLCDNDEIGKSYFEKEK